MENLKLFEEFLFEDRVESLRMKAGVNQFEWEAMRANPENPSDFKKYAKYYDSDGTRNFVSKTIHFVCEMFGDGKNLYTFMLRLAAAESCYGLNPATYSRPNQTKGIFQLDKASALKRIGYQGVPIDGNEDVQKKLNALRAKVKSGIGLDWSQIPYSSLSKPLYNAIACRMYLEVKMRDYKFNKATNTITSVYQGIPFDINGQANWWKNRYNTAAGAGSPAHFKNPQCNMS